MKGYFKYYKNLLTIIIVVSLSSYLFLSCTTQSDSTIKASITINKDENAKAYNPMIFGGFLEHFGKQIYGGVFDPGSPLSNEKGFRTDVVEALNELKVPIIRWPGGCFVDGYHWINGVGDNPIFIPEDDVQLSGANFQGTPVSLPMDMMGAALTMICVLSNSI